MARVVVLGAGIAGHTAALFLRRSLDPSHRVTVVSPMKDWNWIPSNIWVGVGRMRPEEVLVPLRPIYDRLGIEFVQGRAVALHPEGAGNSMTPYVVAQRTDSPNAAAGEAERVKIEYDFLINATGPWLEFGATPGLGPDANSYSVCTANHAAAAAEGVARAIERLRSGDKLTMVVGTGHGLCTCEGAAFEYVFNLEAELRRQGVRDRARLVFLTNEAALGDFGVGGLYLQRGGYVIHSKTFAESLYTERGLEWIVGAHVHKVDRDEVHYETLDGELHTLKFDFAMLLPPFKGAPIQAFNRTGEEITSSIFAPSRFMKVDADYTPKAFDDWRPSDWPKTYQNPTYPNIFAVGIAFAPPHAISRPFETKRGTKIAPAPPRTGMPSAIMGRTAAKNIAEMIHGEATSPRWGASLADLGAACVASAGTGFLSGTAAAMTIYPIIPDYERYPGYGRDLRYTYGEIGSAGHWIKRILHHMFIYKAKAQPFWWMIPE